MEHLRLPALVHADCRSPSEFAASPVHGAFREAVSRPGIHAGFAWHAATVPEPQFMGLLAGWL